MLVNFKKYQTAYDGRDPLDYRDYRSSPAESQLWHDIRRAAMEDKKLHEALERAKILYYLSTHHERQH
jgi:hypothetical protein